MQTSPGEWDGAVQPPSESPADDWDEERVVSFHFQVWEWELDPFSAF